MKLMLLGVCAPVFVGGLYLHGDLDGGELYHRPLLEAYEELRTLPVPAGVEKMSLQRSKTSVHIDRTPSDTIKWVFSNNNVRLGAVVAKLKPAGENQTRINVVFEAGSKDADETRVADARQYLEVVARPVMIEQIDAKLNERPFNKAIVQQAMTAYLLGHMDAIHREVSTQMTEASDRMKPGWYEPPAGRPTASAKPMTDLRKYKN